MRNKTAWCELLMSQSVVAAAAAFSEPVALKFPKVCSQTKCFWIHTLLLFSEYILLSLSAFWSNSDRRWHQKQYQDECVNTNTNCHSIGPKWLCCLVHSNILSLISYHNFVSHHKNHVGQNQELQDMPTCNGIGQVWLLICSPATSKQESYFCSVNKTQTQTYYEGFI